MLRLEDIVSLSGVLEVRNKKRDLPIDICTDSRSFSDGQTFVALKGENFDGTKFVPQVLSLNCPVIVVEQSSIDQVKGIEDQVLVVVENTTHFLQCAATRLSQKFQRGGGKLICISGSNGKTTTKEMLAFICSELGLETIKTQKNNNNHIGVPLTLFQITEKTQVAVVELGSNHPSEIQKLCEISDPAIGLTTNIGHTHMEFFPTLNDVFKEESYIQEYILTSNAKEKSFFWNFDDEHLKKINPQKWFVKLGSTAGCDYQFVFEDNKALFVLGDKQYEIVNEYITGKHNFYNLFVSCCIVDKIFPQIGEKIFEVASQFRPTANRSQWLEVAQAHVYLDAYNANPSSMRAALDGFKNKVKYHQKNLKSTCVIVGDMYELGTQSENLHREIGDYTAQLGVERVIFVGKFAGHYNQGAKYIGEEFDSPKSMHGVMKDIFSKYNFVFIKGSRSLQLESLIDIT